MRSAIAPKDPRPAIDREKITPFLLRVFIRVGEHHREQDFARKEPVGDEVQIYTWPDATLSELSELVKEVSPLACRRGARLSFALVYPDRQGLPCMKQIGRTFAGRSSFEDEKALRSCGFQTGDFLDVAIVMM